MKLYPRDALNIFYIGLNNTMPPLDNDMVRQALAIGIDRQAIVDKFYPAGSSVADYFTPCAIPGGCEGTAWPKYDLAAAQKLLADAGFADGFKIKLAYRDVVRSYLPTPGKVAEEIQAQLKKLNIDATIDVQESGTFIDNAQTGKLEMFLLGWGADYPDQTDFMDVFFGKGADVSFGTHWPDLEDVIAKAAALSDQAERNKLYAQANDLVVQHAPMVPVAHGASVTVFKAALEGGFASPIGNEIFSVMQIPGQETLVWVQNAEPLSLYCADESDGETLRACEQIFDSLLTYKVGGTDVVPALADMPTANADSTEWVVKLHPGIKFSDGTPLTANDVVKSYAVQWDASDPLHVGNTGEFYYWSALFYQFLNAK